MMRILQVLQKLDMTVQSLSNWFIAIPRLERFVLTLLVSVAVIIQDGYQHVPAFDGWLYCWIACYIILAYIALYKIRYIMDVEKTKSASECKLEIERIKTEIQKSRNRIIELESDLDELIAIDQALELKSKIGRYVTPLLLKSNVDKMSYELRRFDNRVWYIKDVIIDEIIRPTTLANGKVLSKVSITLKYDAIYWDYNKSIESNSGELSTQSYGALYQENQYLFCLDARKDEFPVSLIEPIMSQEEIEERVKKIKSCLKECFY